MHYPDEASFSAALTPHLANDPDANPRLLLAIPPKPNLLFVSDTGQRIFLREDDKQRWIPSGRDAKLAKELADALSHLPIPGGLTGDKAVTATFAESFLKRGAKAKLHLDMNWYRMSELKQPKQPRGNWRKANLNDLTLLCTLITDFQQEAVGITRNQDELRLDAQGWIEADTPLFWEHEGVVTAMVNMIPHGNSLVRLGAVYTLPEHRGHGYAKALTGKAAEMALSNGFGVGLNADITHPFTNQMYQSLGFIHRNTCSDYRFTA